MNNVIEKRDVNGNKLVDVAVISNVDANKPVKSTMPMRTNPDADMATPDMPLADAKAEAFICEIVDRCAHGTDELFRIYRNCKFDCDKPIAIAKNDMRSLLRQERVRERLKFLRDAEWELNKPDVQYLSRELEAIVNDVDVPSQVRITAINNIAKLIGAIEHKETASGGTKVAIVFQSQELPPDTK